MCLKDLSQTGVHTGVTMYVYSQTVIAELRPKIHFDDYHSRIYLQMLIFHLLSEGSCEEIKEKRGKNPRHMSTFLIMVN